MSSSPLHLDCNATAPFLPEVVGAMLRCLRRRYGNPSSGHPYGLAAKEAVARAPSEVAELIGARGEEVVFTACATESNNHAILGAAPEIATSTGSACHAGSHAVSGVLAAMELSNERAAGAVRLSIGRLTTEREIEMAAALRAGAWRRLAT